MNDQETLNVGILVLEPFVIQNSDGTYSGFLYDMWTKVKERLNLKVKETFLTKLYITKYINEMHDSNKFDVLIGGISVRKNRLEKVNFTRPILLNRIRVAYKNPNELYYYFKIFRESFLYPLLFLLSIGIVSGLILHHIEPKRGSRIRAIMTTVASMFGEAGFLTENTTLTKPGVVLVVFLLVIAYYFAIYLFTATQVYYQRNYRDLVVTKKNINSKRLLTLNGFFLKKVFNDIYNTPVDYVDDIERIPKLVEEGRYDGFVLDYYSTKLLADKHGFKLSDDVFAIDELAFAVSKQRGNLLEKLNKELIGLQDKQESYEICKKYIGGEDAGDCVL